MTRAVIAAVLLGIVIAGSLVVGAVNEIMDDPCP